MSQQSAPPSRSAVPKLPIIEHPLTKMARSSMPDNLDVHVHGSADGSRPSTQLNDPVGHGVGRPLPAEEGPAIAGSRRSSRNSSRRSFRPVSQSLPNGHGMYHVIPEGVETAAGNPNQVRLPVFGVKNGSSDDRHQTNGGQRPDSRLSHVAKARLEIDQIEAAVKEKMKTSYYEMRKRFLDNDPEKKGNVTRDALLRILVSSTGHPISQKQLSALFERWSFRKEKLMISFPEVFAAVRETSTGEYPSWMDPIQRSQKVCLPAEQVHALLTEKMRQRFVDMADVFPQFIDGGTGRMLKHELKNSLNKMQFYMDDAEFERLWKQYDPQNTGTVSGVNLLKKMGIIMSQPHSKKKPEEKEVAQGTKISPAKSKHAAKPNLRKAEQNRERSLQVETWLKDRLREGFYTLKKQLESFDPERTGLISPDNFVKVLNDHHLSLERRHLPEFLARCAVPNLRDGVPYRDFLHRFQDRSEAGMTHKILSNPFHQKEDDSTSRGLSGLEHQLMQMFHRDFLALLASFKNIDRHGLGVVSQEEFRALMESRFCLELTDEQFRSFVERLPLSKDGLVKYEAFLKQFDTTGLTPSLFSNKKDKNTLKSHEFDDDASDTQSSVDLNKRPVSETVSAIKTMLENYYQDVERKFYDIDVFNSSRLTQEMMYELLKKFIEPEITRGEVRDLWKLFFLRNSESLDFQEFLRHFIYNRKEAAFPNAKVFPPKKGDADLMMRSRKLNGDVILLEDNLRSKIDFLWEQLRNEFVEMDPFGTGCVSREEFQEVLKELAIQLTDYELDKITKKFTQKHDGRVNYVELLRPFALRRMEWRRNHMMEVMREPLQPPWRVDITRTKQEKDLYAIVSKLHHQLSGDWKILRKDFKKIDTSHSGYLTLAEFRSVLQLFNVQLDEEEVFNLMSQFDPELSGKISYQSFLDKAQQEIITSRKQKQDSKQPKTQRKF